ncbi:MAG: Shikimate dehydrogenase (NADP(+)) [Verrucomicrobia subdivision 3 bacterium]|nr:Shikimate dehydrogenase (NADP(+)) [Limisphaerales bacterium]MCS1412487.1 Shikimate dehydrogenase (NADP(+)) [Limisphaerales bacterium]
MTRTQRRRAVAKTNITELRSGPAISPRYRQKLANSCRCLDWGCCIGRATRHSTSHVSFSGTDSTGEPRRRQGRIAILFDFFSESESGRRDGQKHRSPVLYWVDWSSGIRFGTRVRQPCKTPESGIWDWIGVISRLMCIQTNWRKRFEGAKRLHFMGLNLTAPHKLLAVELVNVLDDSACERGAVNTIRFEGRDSEGDRFPSRMRSRMTLPRPGRMALTLTPTRVGWRL